MLDSTVVLEGMNRHPSAGRRTARPLTVTDRQANSNEATDDDAGDGRATTGSGALVIDLDAARRRRR